MTERERLIELLKNDSCQSPMLCDPNCKYASLKRCYEERTADYLLENGVIVMPVKIGEVVYEIYDDEIIEARINRIDIYEDVVDIYTQTEIFDDFDDDDWFSLTDIVRTLFITREEAEKAMKKG